MSRLAFVRPVLLASAIVAGAPPLQAQSAATGDVLFLVRGADTISVERVHRTRERLEGEMLIKSAGARITFTVDVDAQGRATRLTNAFRMGDRRREVGAGPDSQCTLHAG